MKTYNHRLCYRNLSQICHRDTWKADDHTDSHPLLCMSDVQNDSRAVITEWKKEDLSSLQEMLLK